MREDDKNLDAHVVDISPSEQTTSFVVHDEHRECDARVRKEREEVEEMR